MKLNINLLPKKEPTGIDLAIIVTFGLFVFLTGISLGGYIIYTEQSKLEELEANISHEQLLLQQTKVQLEERERQITAENYVLYWQELNHLLDNMYTNPVDIIHEVSRLLPNGAYLTSLSFELDGNIRIDVSFASMGDVALFMENALDSQYINQVNVPYIQAREINRWHNELNQDITETRYFSSIDLNVITVAGGRSE